VDIIRTAYYIGGLELMKLIFAFLDVSLTMGLTRCYKTEGFFTFISVKTGCFGLHFCRRKYRCIFNCFYVISPQSYLIWWNYAEVRAITQFKVIQGHRFWYQSKAHMQLPISD